MDTIIVIISNYLSINQLSKLSCVNPCFNILMNGIINTISDEKFVNAYMKMDYITWIGKLNISIIDLLNNRNFKDYPLDNGYSFLFNGGVIEVKQSKTIVKCQPKTDLNLLCGKNAIQLLKPQSYQAHFNIKNRCSINYILFYRHIMANKKSHHVKICNIVKDKTGEDILNAICITDIMKLKLYNQSFTIYMYILENKIRCSIEACSYTKVKKYYKYIRIIINNILFKNNLDYYIDHYNFKDFSQLLMTYQAHVLIKTNLLGLLIRVGHNNTVFNHLMTDRRVHIKSYLNKYILSHLCHRFWLLKQITLNIDYDNFIDICQLYNLLC